MIITKELIKERFEEYNSKYFDGKLGECTFSLFSKNFRCLGAYQHKESKGGKPKDIIWMGTYIKWTEDLFKEVLIHEMIHMYNHRVENKTWRGTMGHGSCFRKQVRRLKRDYGIILHRFKNLETIDNKKISPGFWERFFTYLLDW